MQSSSRAQNIGMTDFSLAAGWLIRQTANFPAIWCIKVYYSNVMPCTFWANAHYWISVHVPTMYHCLLVPADLTLTTDRLTELFQSVEDPDKLVFVRSDGSLIPGIGRSLGLPESALEEIKSSYQSKTKRKEAYLDTYIHRHPCPSWKKISELLKEYSLEQQASEVEDTYIQGMHLTQSQDHVQYGMSCSCVLEHNRQQCMHSTIVIIYIQRKIFFRRSFFLYSPCHYMRAWIRVFDAPGCYERAARAERSQRLQGSGLVRTMVAESVSFSCTVPAPE